MPHFDHLLRALAISIPLGIFFGLFAGYIRSRWGDTLAEKHASRWETFKRAIFAIGILMFAVLAIYCFYVIKQASFGYIYTLMSVLNVVCLIRSFTKGKYDANGVPVRLQRKPKRVTPAAPLRG